MSEVNTSLLIVCMIALALSQLCYAQDWPQDYVDAHNSARQQVGVGDISWSDEVASYASDYVSQLSASCQMVHSEGPYGENLAWSSGDLSGTDAVDMWVAEISNYDYDSNSCNGGECLHYTQVVWQNSVRVGCAKVSCDNGGGTIISCNYDPPGNYIGQRPFGQGPLLQVPLGFKKN